MSKYITRNVLICVVPSVILLLSVYWFRKKKKFKINSVVSSSPGEIKLDSMAEISSDTADTLSDASSFASPESSEKSIRTKMFPLMTLSKDAASENDAHNCVPPSSNHVEESVCKGDGPLIKASQASLQFYSPVASEEKRMDPAVVDSAASIAKDLITQVEQAVENMGSEYVSKTENRKAGYDEDFLLDVIHNITADSYSLNDVEKLIKAIETDSNDSRSSVLDENSLSYVSDDSESRQPKTKDSLSSVLDENSALSSLCDELEKSMNCESPSFKSNVRECATEEDPVCSETAPVNGEMPLVEVAGDQPIRETLSPKKDLTCDGAVQSLLVDFSASDSSSSISATSSCDNRTSDASCAPLPSEDASPKSSLHLNDCTEGSSPDEKAEPVEEVAAEALQIAEVNIPAHSPLQEQDSCNSSSWSAHATLSEVSSEQKDALCDGKVPENLGQYTYEFELPQELCGRLIGKHGKHVKSIKDRSHANVYIKRHPYDPQLKVVVVEGNRSDVSEALDLIRRKYPPSQYPAVTLVKTNMISSNVLPESLQLHLPEGASCDVILSSLVSAGHFFLQQPTHPTYPSLSTLDQYMNNCYSQLDTPLLPHPIVAGVICAAPVLRGWYRAQVIYVYESGTECELKFVDYGGFAQALTSSLRQIRSDFMSLPFQASQCYLANVRPVDPSEGWSAEVTSTFEELAQGQILQAMLVDYASDGVPFVHLYRVQGISSMFINKELVERGLAVWIHNGHWDPH